MTNTETASPPVESLWPERGPFSRDKDAYRRWRDRKLAGTPDSAADLIVEIVDLSAPTEIEKAAILDRCRRANMAIYACRGRCLDDREVRPDLTAFAATFGLIDLEDHRSAAGDGLVALEVAAGGGRVGFIPYSTSALNWHTDGYYRPIDAPIRAMVLHCVRPAADGGTNGLMDPEIAYIRLRDRDPELIDALMHPAAMTIPEFAEEGRLRPTATGPVYWVDPASGALQMRYTARKRNISWRDEAATKAAAAALIEVMNGDDPQLFRTRLAAGQGLICNNVLHDRTAFEDTDVAGTGRLY
ncbi:MAG: TauD/TfdA family dioxygenase, partial [Hyphomicrobiales bacterium]|nr:TauD/TfdA family dioxygenase [Hyphomicrobiales bacterium]